MDIILLNGPPYSGKDHIARLICGPQQKQIVHAKLSASLKTMALISLSNKSVQRNLGTTYLVKKHLQYTFPKLLRLLKCKFSSRPYPLSILDIIDEEYKHHKYGTLSALMEWSDAFERIKGRVALINSGGGFPKWVTRDNPLPRTATFRDLLIYLSEQIIKPKYGQDWFGARLGDFVPINNNLLVVSDSGFAEEAYGLVRRLSERSIFHRSLEVNNIYLVKLSRPCTSFAGDSRSYISLDPNKLTNKGSVFAYEFYNDSHIHNTWDLLNKAPSGFANVIKEHIDLRLIS